MKACLADKGQSQKQTNLFENFAGNKLKPRRVQLSRRLTVFTLMRLRQFADDSRLILPINPDKAPKKPTTHSFHSNEAKAQFADNSRLIYLLTLIRLTR